MRELIANGIIRGLWLSFVSLLKSLKQRLAVEYFELHIAGQRLEQI